MIGSRLASGAVGAAALAFVWPVAARAADDDVYAPMTPVALTGPRAPHLDASAPRNAVSSSPGKAFVISGAVTTLLGAAQVPIGVALLGSKSECAAGAVFISQCTQSDGAHAVGAYMMVSGGLGVLAGSLLIGIGVGENRARRMKDALTGTLTPALAPGPGGGTATWSF